VWVTGAAGSLAWFVIQFALQRNLQVVAIGRDHDVERLRSIGVQTKERIRWVP
jgi:NADPH:quinone reductase-like Zn-dependent oxidoreductase